MKKIISTFEYCDWKTDAIAIYSNKFTIYFSYNTPIAFTKGAGEVIIRKNDWSTTTGKHLNAIDKDKTKRINGEEFEKLLSKKLNEVLK